jgi:hypothetical protein
MPTPIALLNNNRPDSLVEVRALLERSCRDSITYFASPMDWRDEVLYFLLPDRFSDGNEGSRSLFAQDNVWFRASTGVLQERFEHPGSKLLLPKLVLI